MRRISEVGRNAWCEEPVRSAGLLIDGEDYYRAFHQAALRARRSILLSGWQFDSDAKLLCGEEAKRAEAPIKLLELLNTLCKQRPELEVRILAWDFHLVFALEREWMQELVFEWTTSDRLHYRFDSNHVEGGSHHQKFVVVDGQISFLGGLDLCDHRWDDRRHLEKNPLRVSRGTPHKPFHDVQVYLDSREVAARLTELFECRWLRASGEHIAVVHPPTDTFDADWRPQGAVPVAAERVALSRTDPHGSPTVDAPVREIEAQYREGILCAERILYIETQYFSSKIMGQALCQRLRAPGPRLQVVLVLNMRAETFKEEVAVGLAQAKNIADVRAAAEGTPHRLGVYYTVPDSDAGEPERATYVHSKVMIVDDRWLNVGSANLTNRSLSVDTELNACFETIEPGDALAKSICAVRLGLLCEHLGVSGLDCDPDGLVDALDDRARRRDGRLRVHPSPTEGERTALDVLDPQLLPFDPDGSEDQDDRPLFAEGLGRLWRRFISERDDDK
jgi:phosphatidylserine/phosphatidylglycerophosphate/cardiolipin synthase-like enzyme